VPDKTALFSFARSPRTPVPLPLSRGVAEDRSLIGGTSISVCNSASFRKRADSTSQTQYYKIIDCQLPSCGVSMPHVDV